MGRIHAVQCSKATISFGFICNVTSNCYHQTTTLVICYMMVYKMAGGGQVQHPGSRLGRQPRKWQAPVIHSPPSSSDASQIDIAPVLPVKYTQPTLLNLRQPTRKWEAQIMYYCTRKTLNQLFLEFLCICNQYIHPSPPRLH